MATIDHIEIPHPCSASWAEMDGDARARFCRLCSKVVHDTRALTTCELEKMLETPTPPCLRVHRDRAGRVLTRDRLAALAFAGLAACAGAPGDSGDTAAVGGDRDGVAVIDGVERHPARVPGAGDREAVGPGGASRFGLGVERRPDEGSAGGNDTTIAEGSPAASHGGDAEEIGDVRVNGRGDRTATTGRVASFSRTEPTSSYEGVPMMGAPRLMVVPTPE